MTHEIRNQNGQHIIDVDVGTEIKDMLSKGLDCTYFDGIKLSVDIDYRTEHRRETVIIVEGLAR